MGAPQISKMIEDRSKQSYAYYIACRIGFTWKDNERHGVECVHRFLTIDSVK